jgi:tetratricopeptide (TPR) repeat protein
MERSYRKNLILAITMVMAFLVTDLEAQSSACFFMETYAKGDLTGWEQEIRKIETQKPDDFSTNSESLLARYGYIGYLIGSNQNAKAKKFLDETEKMLEEWLKKKPGNARLLSIKAGLVGFRIGLSPMRAPFLGPRNVEAWEEALKNDPSEPMGWLEKGNSLLYRPAMFGGDSREAETAFRKALQLAKPAGCDWSYMYIQVRLFEACKKNGKQSEAESIRKKLQQKPGHFKWIDAL